MSPEPASNLTAELSETRRILHDCLAGISEDEAARKPEPSRWSVLDCVEHLALTERGLAGRVMAAQPAEPLPPDPAREAHATAVVRRSLRVEAPPHVQPTGRFATLAHALEAFDAARRDTIAFVLDHHGDLIRRTIRHPLFGPLNGEEALLVLCGHIRRHADQICEIRAAHTP